MKIMNKVEADSKKTKGPGTENHHNDQDDIEVSEVFAEVTSVLALSS